MIEFRQVKFAYPSTVLADGSSSGFSLLIDDLNIQQGEHLALTGASGSGKTTMLHLAAGILPPQQGKVTTAGVTISQLADRQRAAFRVTRVGMVFQAFELLPHLTALDNVLLPFRLHAELALTDEVKERARQLADSLGVGHTLPRRPHQLSQGEQQRISIARALITKPSVVLADEPTGNLDPSNKRVAVDLLLDQCQQRHATLLMATHDLEMTRPFDRTCSIDEFAVTNRGHAPGAGS